MTETEPIVETLDNRPTVETTRMLLRPFFDFDAARVQTICNVKEIAHNTRSVPHPYPDGAAIKWIERHLARWRDGRSVVFAMTLKAGETESKNELVGAIGLEINELDQNAELGYWLDKPSWGCGYCTEAAAAVLDYGFDQLALHKIHSHFMVRNPASGRVMEKIGMRREGLLRSHVRKWGVFEDVEFHGILATDERPLSRKCQ